MKRMTAIWGVLCISIGFVWGLYKLCNLRFEQGDIYPAYSSLRSDPLGTKGLYEALSCLPELQVTRNFLPIDQAQIAKPYTWFMIGMSTSLDSDYLHAIRTGTRMVIAFNYIKQNTAFELGLSIETIKDLPETYANKRPSDLPLPDQFPWRDTTFIRPTHKDWQVIYSVQDKPVILERRMGQGSIVVLANSFLLSNEALVNQRQTALISWLCAQNVNLVFDETIHNIQASQGVMTLAKTYHLKGLAMGLLVLVGLFIWSRTPILTAPAHSHAKIIQTHAMDSGLTSLLTYHLSPKKWLSICFQEWRKNLPAQPHLKHKLEPKFDALKRLSETDSLKQAVTQYNLMTDIITQKEPYDTST